MNLITSNATTPSVAKYKCSSGKNTTNIISMLDSISNISSTYKATKEARHAKLVQKNHRFL